MKVLFVIHGANLSEPLGPMLLSAVCKKAGHSTALTILEYGGFLEKVRDWQPDVVAYSAMSAGIELFRAADAQLRAWTRQRGQRVFRIMGGPHPTYYPEVVEEMELDAICQGDGEEAMRFLLERLESGRSLEGIPNIGLTREGAPTKAMEVALDALPFADRQAYCDSVPYYRHSGLRSFYASRGCPYKCTYCFNHAYHEMFAGCGPMLRRRSVENLIAEIEEVMRRYPPLRFVRFGDDTFSYKADDWLREFSEQYRRRIGKPFYCLMRSNTLTEDTARLLSEAGCRSISMSIESGVERVRNEVLKRNLTDDMVRRSFAIARKYNLPSFSNSILGIPGTTLQDDWKTLEFSRSLRQAAPSFTICCPYPGTELWQIAVSGGFISPTTTVGANYMDLSALNCYTQREKELQARMCYFGGLYCCVPGFLVPLVKWLIRSRLPLGLCNLLGMMYVEYRLATRVFRWAIPLHPRAILSLIKDTVRFWKPRRWSHPDPSIESATA